VASSLELLIR